MHAHLDENGYRTSGQREFFDVEIDTAIDALLSASEMPEQSGNTPSFECDDGDDWDNTSSKVEYSSAAPDDEVQAVDTKFQPALKESGYAWLQLLDFYKALLTYNELAEIDGLRGLDAIVEGFNIEFRSLADVARGIIDDYPNTEDLMYVLRVAGGFYTELDKNDGDLYAQTERMLQGINAWYQDGDDKLSELPGSLPSIHITLADLYSWCQLLEFHYRQIQIATYSSSELAVAIRDLLELEKYDEGDWLGTTLTHVSGLQQFTRRIDNLFDDLRMAVKCEFAFDFCDFDNRIEHFRLRFRRYRARREDFRSSFADLWQRAFGNDENLLPPAPFDDVLRRAIAHLYGDEEAGVLVDRTEARRLFKSASHMGSARADWELGKMALESSSPDRIDQAASHFKYSARKGEAAAHLELAILFADLDQLNAKISVNNYWRAIDLRSNTPSKKQCLEILRYFSRITNMLWPVPKELVSVFANIRPTLAREFTIDPSRRGLLRLSYSDLRLDGEEEAIDRVEDCLDQLACN